jgi:hypothetical protein
MWKQVYIDYQTTYFDSIFVKDTLKMGGYLGCNELGCRGLGCRACCAPQILLKWPTFIDIYDAHFYMAPMWRLCGTYVMPTWHLGMH